MRIPCATSSSNRCWWVAAFTSWYAVKPSIRPPVVRLCLAIDSATRIPQLPRIPPPGGERGSTAEKSACHYKPLDRLRNRPQQSGRNLALMVWNHLTTLSAEHFKSSAGRYHLGRCRDLGLLPGRCMRCQRDHLSRG